jgi:hypothetical protein
MEIGDKEVGFCCVKIDFILADFRHGVDVLFQQIALTYSLKQCIPIADNPVA